MHICSLVAGLLTHSLVDPAYAANPATITVLDSDLISRSINIAREDVTQADDLTEMLDLGF